MTSDDKRIKYSDSPFAPDWARAPEKRGDVVTSFGKPIPEAEDNPHLDFGNQENSASKAKNDEAADQPFKPTVGQIEEILWQDANDDINVYCIMDGYWADGLYGRLLTSDDISWAHMFQGDVATRNIQQAPFIIALKRGHKLTKWLIEEGWGQGWGIYFTASNHKAHLLYGNPCINDKRFLPSNEEQLKLGNLTKGPEDPLWKMRRHFRQFSDVYLESENKIVDFRYYDPAVLRDVLLYLSEGFKQLLFRSIEAFYDDCFRIDLTTKDIKQLPSKARLYKIHQLASTSIEKSISFPLNISPNEYKILSDAQEEQLISYILENYKINKLNYNYYRGKTKKIISEAYSLGIKNTNALYYYTVISLSFGKQCWIKSSKCHAALQDILPNNATKILRNLLYELQNSQLNKKWN